MKPERQNETFEEQLESLRTEIAEVHGLADMVDNVYQRAMHMDIGDVANFDARHSNLRVEYTESGFISKLEPKMSLSEVFKSKGLEFPEKD